VILNTGKNIMEKFHFIRKKRILFFRLAFLPLIFVGLFVWRKWKDESLADFSSEWGGYVLLLLGVGIRIWATLYIGQRKSKELITEGPFSICRNPLYVGSLLIMLGVSLCMENLVLLAAGLLIMIPTHIWVILVEEKHLAKVFGEQYLEYKHRVPRFGFAFRNFHTAQTIEVSVRSIYRATGEAMLALTVPIIGDLIETLHANGILPVLWKF